MTQMKYAALALLLVGCTAPGGDKNSDDTGDSPGDGFTWVAPDDVGVEEPAGWELGEQSGYEALYSGDTLLEYTIELSDDAYSDLRRDPYEWVQGAFVYDGRRYEPVGVRLKGENSFEPITQKPSMKVDFNKYVSDMRFYGLKGITLNNMDNDYSMMHERVAYWMYRQAGVPAARAAHARLHLNDEYKGVYAMVQSVDRIMASEWWDNTDEGRMFEVWDVDFYDRYISQFQLEFGDDDRTALQGTADALEGTGNPALNAAREYMDYDQFLLYYAVSAMVGQFDSYPYANPGDDAHVYQNPATGLLEWLPHGVDETFYYPDRDIQSVNGIVARRCLDTPACQREFVAKVWEVYDLSLEVGLLAYAQDVQAQIRDYVAEDDNKPYTTNQVYQYQNAMLSFIETRAATYEAQLGPR